MSNIGTGKKNKCAACLNEICDRRFLECAKCLDTFDLECVNVSEKRFYNTMTAEYKKSWICPQCKSKQPKLDNTNTPVRHQAPTSDTSGDLIENTQQQNLDFNVTLRRKLTRVLDCNESVSSNCSPPHGETLDNTTCVKEENLILKEIREIKSQLSFQNQTQESFKNDLTATMKAIFEGINDINKKYAVLETDIKVLRSTVEENTNKINKLEKENKRLRYELDKSTNKDSEGQTCISNTLEPHQSEIIKSDSEHYTINTGGTEKSPKTVEQILDSSKIIVLYGLNEYKNETEFELYDRVLSVFHDIVQVNISGYIEDMNRIGQKGYRRPLKIELLSKRMTKYLLAHSYMFKKTGLWISEYLDNKGLQQRKEKRQLHKNNNHTKFPARERQTNSFHSNPRPSTAAAYNGSASAPAPDPQQLSQEPQHIRNNSFRH